MTLSGQSAPVSTVHTTLVRLLLGLQAFFWVGHLLVLALLLVTAARYGSFDFYPFGHGDMRDPKEVLGLGIPEYILHIPLMVVALLAPGPACSPVSPGV